MKVEIKQKTKSTLTIIICSILFFALQVGVVILSRNGIGSFNGCALALQYGLCLFMIKDNRKSGIIAALVLLGIGILITARALIIDVSLTALPGIFNEVFYIVTIIILFNISRQRERDAITDLLTGLRNRRGLYAHLKRLIEDEVKFNVIYLDLENFKVINDNYGHSYGDKLLLKVAASLKNIVGKNGDVSRVGGYDFVVVLDSKVDPEQTANYLLATIREKISIENNNTLVNSYLTCYAGIAMYPKDANDYEKLIKCADIAMYHAANEKSATACFYDNEMAASLGRDLEIENLIKDGLEKDYFYLVYQPQYDLTTKKLRGFESLLRLNDTNNDVVSPKEFIPIAERGELILKIDDYVLERAMREFRPIVLADPSITVSINVSAKNIGSPDFAEKLQAIITKTEFPSSNLEIEITEYCLVQSMDTTINTVRQLRSSGIQVALDDFGTGFTSLNYLSKMPINLLKIDKSLVDDIEMDSKRLDFVNAVISLGHLMGCEVISEGVENEKQISLLREKGSDYVQGYVWSKPVSYEDAKAMIM